MRPGVLFAMVLAIATAGLIYELTMAAVASYLLGDSVQQFSLIIGLYLSALGVGAYASRFVERDLVIAFVDVELAAALVGGFSAPLLFLTHALSSAFRPVLFLEVLLVGTLVGLELPLLLRILERRLAFRELVARALAFDYAGALLGSLAFSFLCVPELGLVHTSLLSGFVNAAVGLCSSFVLKAEAGARELGRARLRAYLVLLVLGAGVASGARVGELSDAALYPGRVLCSRRSPYQRIVLSKNATDLSLHLNGHLQFSSLDEARYHEALVHPAALLARARRRIFIGGGGDGLALREILKWREVEQVTLVDLDRAVTDLAQSEPELARLNHHAFHDPRVQVVNADAKRYLEEHAGEYDVLIMDFPDPSSYALGKLFSVEFYRLARSHLAAGGVLVAQATSPLFARAGYWCVARSLQAAGLQTLPYHVFVPSFGEWGFVLAAEQSLSVPRHAPRLELRYLDDQRLQSAFVFPRDMAEVPVRPNRLDNQALVSEYLADWSRWN